MRIAECKFLKGEESLISKNRFCSASSGNRDLWSNARRIRGITMKGRPFLFQVMVLVSQQWSLPQGLLTVSGHTNWWSQSCLILQSYRKPQKQVHVNNSRAVPSKSTSGVLTEKKCDRDLRCTTPSWMISALQQPGTGAHGCKYWRSSSSVLRRKRCWW